LLILIAAEKLGRLVRSTGDLLHGVVRHGAIVVVEGFLQQTHHQVSVYVIDAEDQRLARQTRVDVGGQRLLGAPVEAHDAERAVAKLRPHIESTVVPSPVANDPVFPSHVVVEGEHPAHR
jgi:hypothetical protein